MLLIASGYAKIPKEMPAFRRFRVKYGVFGRDKMELINRQEAMEQGLRTYYTGRPCIRKHIAERYTVSGACTQCLKAASVAVHQGKLESTEDKRVLLKSLSETSFRCFDIDAQPFTDTVVALTLARYPEALTADDVVGKWKPSDRQAGTAMYRFRIDAEDVAVLREVARAMLNSHSANGAALREQALGQAATLAGAPRDNQAGEWTFK